MYPDSSPPRKNSTVSEVPPSLKSSRFNEEVVDTFITIPPDGGWGWMIVVASFVCNLMADGTIYTFGIFLEDIGESFKVHPTQVAIGNSLMSGFYYLIGPVSCALVNRCGFRTVGFIGGLLSAVAICVCSFMKSNPPFLFFFGVLGGCGFGMAYVPSIIVIGFYFDKWRSLATSIAVTGSAVGIMLFPIIVEGVLSSYNWRNKLRVLSVGCLITCVLALVYRPLKPVRVISEDTRRPIILNEDDEDSIGSFNLEKSPNATVKNVFSRYHNIAYPTASQMHGTTSQILMGSESSSSKTSVFISNIPGGSMATILRTTTSKLDEQSKLSTVYEVESEEQVIEPKTKCCPCMRCPKCDCQCCQCGKPYYNRPMYRDDIFYAVPVPKNTLISLVPSRISSKHAKVLDHI